MYNDSKILKSVQKAFANIIKLLGSHGVPQLQYLYDHVLNKKV